MTQETQKTALFGFWHAILETSEVAVAVNYSAPWTQPARPGGETPRTTAMHAAAACG